MAFAGAFYLTFSPGNRPLALLGSCALVAAGVILAIHDMINFAVTPIAMDYATASGVQAAALEAVGGLMIITAQ